VAANRAVDTSGFASMSVAVFGLRDVQRALRTFAPDLKKEMDREIRAAIQPVRSRAQSSVPNTVMSGWGNWTNSRSGSDLTWDPRKIKSGIRITQGGRGRAGSGVRVAWKIQNTSAIGMIVEYAGRRGATGQFIANLDRHAAPSRLIWAAWDDLGGEDQVVPKVLDAIAVAEDALHARFAAASDGPA
jgi:hypothetical protein